MSEPLIHRMVGEAVGVLCTLAAGLTEPGCFTQEHHWSYYLDCPRHAGELAGVFAASRFAIRDGQVHTVLSGHGPEEPCEFAPVGELESTLDMSHAGRVEGQLRLANPRQVGNSILSHPNLRLQWSRDDMFMGHENLGGSDSRDWLREPVYVCSYVISAIAAEAADRGAAGPRFLMQVCCISDDCSMLVVRATVPMGDAGGPNQLAVPDVSSQAISGKLLLRRLPASLGLRLSSSTAAVAVAV